MIEQTEIAELREIYHRMDTEGRETMAAAAAQLLTAQKSFEDKPKDAQLPEHKENEE